MNSFTKNPISFLAAGLALAAWLTAGAALPAAPLELKPEVGTTFEVIERGRFESQVVQPRKKLVQLIETGQRDVGRVLDTTGGEIRIGTRALHSAMKVNGKTREGGVPGAGEMMLRVYAPRGNLIRTYPAQMAPGDVRELAVQFPAAEVRPGMKWRQTFQLRPSESEKPIAIQAEFELLRTTKFKGRDAYEIRGALSLPRTLATNRTLSAGGEGKALLRVDVATGLTLAKKVRMHVEQVREDAISLAYAGVTKQKYGVYIDFVREAATVYLGTGAPPSLSK